MAWHQQEEMEEALIKLTTLTAAALGFAAVVAQADDVVRVGTLKFAHYAGIS